MDATTTTALENTLRDYFPLGFPLSRPAWDRLDILNLLNRVGDVLGTPETYLLRQLADRLNEKLQRSSHPTEPIQAGQLISVGVIVDVLRYLIVLYSREEVPEAVQHGMDWAGQRQGRAIVDQPPHAFVWLFPPLDVVRGRASEDQFLNGASPTADNRETVVQEMILLFVSMANPAFRRFRVLFDDLDLKQRAPYESLIHELEDYFDRQPVFSPIGQPLFECLRAPMRAAPESLEGQLHYIKDNWAKFLPPELLKRLLLATDILKEERQMRGLGPGPSMVLEFGRRAYGDDYGLSEPENFSRDADWMSNVVLIAKTVYVWLDQLSKKYQRHIRYLSDVPDEELDQLARWGFSGLWLIGLWERSPASQKIKQIMGNPEAVPSAYSLYDYTIAEDLGGETAYENLRQRAWNRGIRLASDMVPNHMGIYSRWVIQHPDWFLQAPYPPFPSYRFTGIDLSLDPRVCIQIEDGYWEHRDAAVVFKRIDKWTGDVRYIYHGNDGTSMPWNDTAQLNFTLPEVREAVIQTILHVARKFPIIRFDAAMTLAKKHYQRLWFPHHGDGGAIPSRAEYGMSREDFDRVFPTEFWREVVDRIKAEAPDTLLLAEAFWLMEGYFVRTLGMHRVYNSAFMNMLKMEDNSKYRMTVKNVLEFSPEVLKRFVNFMNNPDELTAVDQFGKGDKYFGVAVMLVTMPGLPMFGHGQIEGFAEKYGMEYRRAYWDEQVDEEMVRRHERQVFPLMRRRRLFSGADNFAFFDFSVPEGWVDENVFAYSNRYHDERGVILYNNAYNTTKGRIHTSTAINTGTRDEPNLVRRGLAEALALNTGDEVFYSFRDHATGLEYLRTGRQIRDEGLFAELHAYQFHAFLDWREIHDTDGSWRRLAWQLNGAGVPSIRDAYLEMQLEPLLDPFRAVLADDLLQGIVAGTDRARAAFGDAVAQFYTAIRNFIGADGDIEKIMDEIAGELDALEIEKNIARAGLSAGLAGDIESIIGRNSAASYGHILAAWAVIRHVGRLHASDEKGNPREITVRRLDEWLLTATVEKSFRVYCKNDVFAHFDALLTAIITSHLALLAPAEKTTLGDRLTAALENPLIREYLQINRHNGVFWMKKEQLERMAGGLLAGHLVVLHAVGNIADTSIAPIVHLARELLSAAERAGYQVEKFLEYLS